MSGHKIIAIIVTRKRENCQPTLLSIKNQTCKVDRIVFADKIFPKTLSIGKRCGSAMRYALRQINLEEFTHFLRVDGDVTLPCNFLEETLKLNAAVVGHGGYAQLVEVKPFLTVLGLYPIHDAEDSYLIRALVELGYSYCSHHVVKPCLPSPTKYRKEQWFLSGRVRYQLGCSIFNPVFSWKDRRSSTLVGFNCLNIILGYIHAWATKTCKCGFVREKNSLKRFVYNIACKLRR